MPQQKHILKLIVSLFFIQIEVEDDYYLINNLEMNLIFHL